MAITERSEIPVGEELRYTNQMRSAVALMGPGDVFAVTESSSRLAPVGRELVVEEDHIEEVTASTGETLTSMKFCNGNGPFVWLLDSGERGSLGEVLGLRVVELDE